MHAVIYNEQVLYIVYIRNIYIHNTCIKNKLDISEVRVSFLKTEFCFKYFVKQKCYTRKCKHDHNCTMLTSMTNRKSNSECKMKSTMFQGKPHYKPAGNGNKTSFPCLGKCSRLWCMCIAMYYYNTHIVSVYLIISLLPVLL